MSRNPVSQRPMVQPPMLHPKEGARRPKSSENATGASRAPAEEPAAPRRSPASPANVPGDTTRERILDAALELFGERGLHAASVRDVAKLAKANVAAISYHFGGKEELYLAVAGHVAAIMGSRIAERAPQIVNSAPPANPQEALAHLELAFDTIVDVIVGHEDMRRVSRFILREQMSPTAAFDIIYAQVMERMHRTVCLNFGVATGLDPDSETVRLRTFLLIGQGIFLRVAEAVVLRRLGADRYTPSLLDEIKAMLRTHLHLVVTELRGRKGEA
ncbi:CerR family C-terminal domain-containing protein [Afifella sp. H1R]|uniref:CerR family C-terminal domain-containing protein n=1 Tax=Afifella sp. H1R TaxID=2908841 RepID=UPI001F1CE536|nr:CerR family C-terminal domain-containing protein [Afifella sp. H1R]MCF1504647.1 CerR family C-terminal domain-containing protein [Afifella sp. H1R]